VGSNLKNYMSMIKYVSRLIPKRTVKQKCLASFSIFQACFQGERTLVRHSFFCAARLFLYAITCCEREYYKFPFQKFSKRQSSKLSNRCVCVGVELPVCRAGPLFLCFPHRVDSRESTCAAQSQRITHHNQRTKLRHFIPLIWNEKMPQYHLSTSHLPW